VTTSQREPTPFPLHARSSRGIRAGALVALGVAWTTTASAITVGQLDTFQNGTTLQWVDALNGAISPVPPTVVANAGPGGAGDFALRISATGSVSGPGGRLVANNIQARWIGSYTQAGVNGIMLDLRNLSAVDLTIRVGIDGPAVGTTGGRWVSQGVVVPSGSGWRTLTFSLLPGDLLPGDFAATSATTTLANVAVLRVMHAPVAGWVGAPQAAQMDIDDIEALPEPTFALSLLVGSLFVRSLGSSRGH